MLQLLEKSYENSSQEENHVLHTFWEWTLMNDDLYSLHPLFGSEKSVSIHLKNTLQQYNTQWILPLHHNF